MEVIKIKERLHLTISKDRREEVKRLADIYGLSESAMINFMIGKFLSEEKNK